MKLYETDIGIALETTRMVALFGNKDVTIEKIKKSYSDLEIKRIHQTHTCIAVQSILDPSQSVKELVNADAHYTFDHKLALCISTADCVPLLILAEKDEATKPLVAAIHAGWRGVAAQIIKKTILKIVQEGFSVQDLRVLIGPHIQKPSFEVGNDVRDQILDTVKGDNKKIFFNAFNPQKSLVDLNLVVKHQLIDLSVPEKNVTVWQADTFSSPNYHSYRRDKETSGRQISFIALK